MDDVPAWALAARGVWTYRGVARPEFAVNPGEDQESVWDYPRPPRLEADTRHVVVRVGDVVIAESRRCCRVLETSSPPTFYLPPQDVEVVLLDSDTGSSACEWKGIATYLSLHVDGRILENVAWSYRDPFPEFARIKDFISFYPARIECLVDDHRVAPQPGCFYGGWVTPELVGPFKGSAGSQSW